jgi:hypothetical protein
MQNYILTASLAGARTATATIQGHDDDDATWQAVDLILDRAYAAPNGPWGRGSVTLVSPTGEVVHSMPAKGEQ